MTTRAKTAKRALAGLAALSLFACGASRAGEAEKPEKREKEPSFYAEVSWRQAQEHAHAAKLVVLAEVTEAGKASGKGWPVQGSARGVRPAIPGLPGSPAYQGVKVDLQQELAVEVREVLRGRAPAGPLRVRLRGIALDAGLIQQRTWRPQEKDPRKRRRTSIPAAEFGLEKGARYVLFLGEPQKPGPGKEGGDGGAGEKPPASPPLAAHLDSAAPAEARDAQVLDSVRAFCKALADWADPPPLPPEEEARVRALVDGLGHEDYREREAADAGLRQMGARIRRHIERAAGDRDAERVWRAREILKAIEPLPGREELPGFAPRGDAGGAAAPPSQDE